MMESQVRVHPPDQISNPQEVGQIGDGGLPYQLDKL